MTIFGLLLNLVGVVLLFLFGMPFRVATGDTLNIDVQVKRIDDLFSVLGWIGLLAIVLGTLFQILARLPKRW